VPSEKRARQRALREQKRAVLERRRRRRLLVRRVVGLLAVVIAVVLVVVFVFAPGSHSKSATAKRPTPTSLTSTTAPARKPLPCPPATPAGSATKIQHFPAPPPLCVSPTGVYDATFVTDVGTFVVRMDAAQSLAAVNNFVYLARYHFYDGTIFHRVIPGFVVQGGDPTGTGRGGPGYTWTGNTPPASCVKAKDCYPVGGLAMANSAGPSTNGSQFFIVLPGGQSTLDQEPNYTLFGQVISGMSVVERIGADGSPSGTPRVVHHLLRVTITQVSP
jgi:cyclophilin family peptidyl-prolyl cis-trans isomerase